MIRKECLLSEENDENDYCPNIFENYEKRPLFMENVCLHQFASEWQFVVGNGKGDDDDENEDFNEKLVTDKLISHQVYTLIDSRKQIRKRSTRAKVKVPFVSVADNEQEYYYQLLVLFIPFNK